MARGDNCGIITRRIRAGAGVMFAACSLLALAGCATRGGPLPYGGANLDVPDRRAPEEAAYDTPLGPLDVVHMTVFRIPELTGDYQVDAKGMIALPLIGTVSARDTSPDDFAARLRRLYGERYLNNPDIAIRVLTTNGDNVTIEGGVNASGVYTLPGKTTLVGAIALAHGINEDNGNAKRVAIFRKQNGRTVGAAFDLTAIHKGTMIDPVVYPGDVIVIDSNTLRQIYRDSIQGVSLISVFRGL